MNCKSILSGRESTGCGARGGRLHLLRRGPAKCEFKCRRCHDLSYESNQDRRSSESALWLTLPRRWGCSTREARDTFRRHAGAYLYEVRVLNFEPRRT